MEQITFRWRRTHWFETTVTEEALTEAGVDTGTLDFSNEALMEYLAAVERADDEAWTGRDEQSLHEVTRERSDSDVLREIGMDDEADDLDEHLGGNF